MKKAENTEVLRFRFLTSLFAVENWDKEEKFKKDPVLDLYNLGFNIKPIL